MRDGSPVEAAQQLRHEPAKFTQQLAVAAKVGPQHLGHGGDILAVGYGSEHMLLDRAVDGARRT